MWAAMERAFLAVAAFCAVIARWLATTLAMVTVACLLLQVFFRYVIGNALVWSEEMALLTFAWVVLLLTSVGVREGFHVRLGLFLSLLPALPRAVMERVLLLGIGIFGVFLTVSGYRYVTETSGQISAAIGYPTELLHASAMVAGVLITIQAVARLLTGPVPAGDPELADDGKP
jgi:TRAP-type C4-dicarboxylate transport system permease small subunit